jgi:hypothetical protein
MWISQKIYIDNIQMDYYDEKCTSNNMPVYPFFLDKLRQIESLCQLKVKTQLSRPTTKVYQLGNIRWTSSLRKKIIENKSYPSSYFISAILNTTLVDNQIVNPPLIIPKNLISSFRYIPLHYNKLLIIDALMKQGSNPRYENNGEYLYSEHAGGISIKDGIIDNIIVSTQTDRTDDADVNIYLPHNTPSMSEYYYLFHTHPNTITYGGRFNEGIVYEFPSASDVLNFVKYHNEGNAQASLVVTPEGSYLIRPLKYVEYFDVPVELAYFLRKYVLRLEKKAVAEFQQYGDKITDADFFNANIGNNFKYINKYNRYLRDYNLYIEYYPREKKNGEWCLRQINLPFINRV